MITRHSFAALPICVLAFAIACSGDSSGPPAVASVDVLGPIGDLVIGQTLQLAATPRDANSNALTNRTITWSTSNASTATVSSAGLVTGVAAGSVTITATAEAKSGSRNVTVVPPPVATVTVTSAAGSIQAGQMTQVTAVMRDANNAVLDGRAVAWTTSDAAIASVSGSGVVTGVAPGTVTITGTSEGKTGSVQIAITPIISGDAPVISAVSPNPLVEGQAATITGTNFAAAATANVVRVGGVPASVTSASATSLQIVVPALNCKPAQNVSVEVTSSGALGAPKSAPFRPAGTFTLAVGQQQRISNPADFCLQFAATPASETYLIGVQSVSENVASVTPVNVTSEASAGAVTSAAVARLATAPVFSASLASPIETGRAARMAKHRAVAAQLLEADRAFLAPRLQSLRAAARTRQRSGASASLVPSVPATAKVGDVLSVKVPDRTSTSFCSNSIPVSATVRTIGTRSIILEDTANPAGGFSEAQYQALSDEFDNRIYATDAAYFGDPTDLDANTRVVILITKEVNKITNLLGQVFSVDLVPQSQCASSNEGEVFYGKAPDPDGLVNGKYATADALLDASIIIAHEFTHVIQLGRRLYFPGATAFQSTWELEGQATFAEEVNGFAALGLAPGQNLGFSVAFNSPATAPVDWFVDMFGDLAVYYGFQSRTSRTPGAPEECSWLATRTQGNNGPCLSGREPYGVPASFLRWLSDQYGPTFAGGEKAIHRQLIDNAFTGFATISNVIGAPIDVLLAQWAAALYVDDRFPGMDSRLGFSSWNLKNIESGLVQPAWLTPRDRQFGAFSDPISVRGASLAYFLVSGAGRGATGIRMRDGADGILPGSMRVWVVRVQ